MEEIKINKEWYEGLLQVISRLEVEILIFTAKNDVKYITLMGELSHLKGYAESLQTQFENEQLPKS